MIQIDSTYYTSDMIREKLNGQHFMHHIGFELTEIREGYIEGEMELKGFSRQQMGYVHGGITATVADIVAGFAAYSMTSPPNNVVTIEIKISYFKVGKGDKLKAIGRVIKPGRKVHFCESEVYVWQKDKWELIAKASTSMAVI